MSHGAASLMRAAHDSRQRFPVLFPQESNRPGLDAHDKPRTFTGAPQLFGDRL